MEHKEKKGRHWCKPDCECQPPLPSVEEKKCSGAHCRCMDIGGQCQNMHWYHCKEHNPDFYPKGGTRPVPKCNAESNGLKCRPPCTSCYGGVQMTASTPQHPESWEERFDNDISPIFYKINKTGAECTDNKYKVKDYISQLLVEASICKDCKTCNSGKTMYERGYTDGYSDGAKIYQETYKVAVQETLRDLLDLCGSLPIRVPLPKHLLAIDIHKYAQSKGIILKDNLE